VTLGSKGRFWVTLTPGELIEAVGMLREKFSITQLAVIVGEDVRDAFLCNYVFTGPRVVVLQVRLDHEKPRVPSLAMLIPGAMVYERELKDLFGSCRPDIRSQTPGSAGGLAGRCFSVAQGCAVQPRRRSNTAGGKAKWMIQRFAYRLGPQHPFLKEPAKFDFDIHGEEIVGARMNIGYNHAESRRPARPGTIINASISWSASAASVRTRTPPHSFRRLKKS